jgi:glucosamine--fructose-6-phosphate aminotransferase (isomerizing)
MCGIFGITKNIQSEITQVDFQKIFKTLFLLSESRGKEASGMALLNKDITVFKTPFAASKMVRSTEYSTGMAKVHQNDHSFISAIGHSRLVTDGSEQYDKNNQPVIKSNIVGIHNGIIVNAKALWEKYQEEEKLSELDSEIIFTLIRRFFNQEKSLTQSLKKTFKEIYGMTSVAMLFGDLDNLLLATNNGSLYFLQGKDKHSFIFASEYYILKTLTQKKSFSRFFEPADISQLKPNTAGLIELNTQQLEIRNISIDSVDTGFNGITTRSHMLPIINLTKKKEKISPEQKEFQPQEVSFYIPDEFSQHFNESQKRIEGLKRCTRCILPETFPFIEFDEKGVCNLCNNYKKLSFKGRESLEEAIAPYRKSNQKPECIVAFSGGRDSSYSLHYLKKELDINPIAYSYDWGMITDLARRNQARLCGKLGVEHILISADIRKKRSNIRKNVLAWLKRPSLGTVPLFMAGDKQYFYYANQLMKQNNIGLVILGENMLETTYFKSGFCGIAPDFNKGHTYSLSTLNKIKMAIFYAKEYMLCPPYINSSILDTLGAFASYYMIPHNYINFYEYIKWEEDTIESNLIGEYDWETDPSTQTTWRIGDGTASFYNYIYYIIAGFNENDTFRSNQIREGMISREKALEMVQSENNPRWEAINWYCNTIKINFEETIRTINHAPKRYIKKY